METLGDLELLAEYRRTGSEAAFAALVNRYVHLVHSTACRFTGNPHHADEITQAVFIILARKAGALRPGTILPGWLYQTARLTAANFMKREVRRQRREQEAYMQSTLSEPESAAAWEQIAPRLDEAMGGLGEADRNAIVLRFFQNKSVPEVATLMQGSEAAAYKRLTRAVEKLRRFFVQRGIALSALTLGSVIAANSVQAAPAHVAAASVSAAAQGNTASAAALAAAQATLRLMAWLKLKFSFASGLTLVLLGGLAVLAFANWQDEPPAVPHTVAAAVPIGNGPAALIVTGLMPPGAPEDVAALAAQTRRLLITRGFAEERVVLLDGKVTRDQVLEQLRVMAGAGGGEFWLVLFGISGRAQNGSPAFQVSGARLAAEDLRAALDAIPGQQFVFIGTGNSGAYLPLLQAPRRTVLAATRAVGEPDQPRYLSAWAQAFADAPEVSFAALAGRAAAAVDAFYARANLAQSEHAQITNPATGEIMDALRLAIVPPNPL